MGTYDTIGGTPRDDVKYKVEQPIPRCPLIMLVNMVGLGKYYSIDMKCAQSLYWVTQLRLRIYPFDWR